MDPTEWMINFRLTHEKAKAKKLSDGEYQEYLGMREELARSLLSAQSLSVPAGENHRKYFRVSQMYNVEIDRIYKAVTRSVSRNGFSANLPSQLPLKKTVSFAIILTRDQEPVTGEAVVVSAVKQGAWNTAFSVTVLDEANAEKLESALFDAVLQRFK